MSSCMQATKIGQLEEYDRRSLRVVYAGALEAEFIRIIPCLFRWR